MSKLILCTTFSVVALALVAADRKELTPEERAARMAKAAEEAYRSTGGLVRDMRPAKGRVVYVNAQTRVGDEVLREHADALSRSMRIVIEVEKGAFSFPDVSLVGETTLFLIDDPKFPSILSAPDQGWAAVNVAAINAAGGSPKDFAARLRKELSRALASAAGGFDSGYPNNPVGPIATLTDLDRYVEYRLAVDVTGRMTKALKARGVTQYRMTTYERACMEGWAHKPTNDVEKAIWEDVHKLPTNPITIKPESQRK